MSFKHRLSAKTEEFQFCSDQTCNTDETSAAGWKVSPNKTYVASNQEKKTKKQRVKFLATTNVTGLHKRKPFVIGKPNKLR